MAEKSKPVTLVTTSPFKMDGEHYEVGQIVPDVPAEQAKELTGAGRTKLATAEDITAWDKAQAAKTKAAKA